MSASDLPARAIAHFRKFSHFSHYLDDPCRDAIGRVSTRKINLLFLSLALVFSFIPEISG